MNSTVTDVTVGLFSGAIRSRFIEVPSEDERRDVSGINQSFKKAKH